MPLAKLQKNWEGKKEGKKGKKAFGQPPPITASKLPCPPPFSPPPSAIRYHCPLGLLWAPRLEDDHASRSRLVSTGACTMQDGWISSYAGWDRGPAHASIRNVHAHMNPNAGGQGGGGRGGRGPLQSWYLVPDYCRYLSPLSSCHHAR